MSDGLVVASCGLCSEMASKSPVSATTVVYRFNDSRRFIVIPRVGRWRPGFSRLNPGRQRGSGFAERRVSRAAVAAGAGAAVGRQVFQEPVDRLDRVRGASRGGDLFGGLWGGRE